MIRKITVILTVLLLLTSCFGSGKSNSSTVETGISSLSFENEGRSYRLIVPFNESNNRLVHMARGIYRSDNYEITAQLLNLSSNHFNPDQLYISEGNLLRQEVYSELLRFNTEEVVYGLNPKADEVFMTQDNQYVTQPILLADIFEVDFYKEASTQSELAGISFALILNGSVEMEDGSVKKIKEDQLRRYGENAALKMLSILRNQENIENVPILLSLYTLEKQDSNVPGGMISYGLFEKNSGQFTSVNTQWLILPSTTANTVIGQVASEYSIFYNAMKDFLPSEQVGSVGFAKIVNGELTQLKVSIHTTGKTYLEMVGIGQYAIEMLNQRFSQTEFDIVVNVLVNQETKMMIERKNGKIQTIHW